jgi:hypothetical protein
MQLQSRSKECVLADLTSKLQQLPPGHPDRPSLARVIVALRAELAFAAARPTLVTAASGR